MTEIYLAIATYVGLVIWLTIEGGKRKIGHTRSFLFCFFLTPFVGFLIVYSSRKSISYVESRFNCPRCKYEFTEVGEFCPLCEKDGHQVKLEKSSRVMT